MTGFRGGAAVFLSAVLLVLYVILMVPAADAALLGVDKVSIEYNDVLRGGYASDNVIVSTGAQNDIAVYYEAQGDIKDWVSFDPPNGSMKMNANNPSVINIVVQPPRDTAVGEYEGTVLITTGALSQQTGSMGSSVVVAFEIKLKVKITDTQILSCTAGGFDIRDFEIGAPLEFSATAGNNGNVRIRPNFLIKIYDQSQQNLLTTFNYTSPTDILPTLSGSVSARINNTLGEGQYWAVVSSPLCSSESLLTFSVLEKGGISDIGDFVRMQHNPWALTGEIVPINASFRNRGSRIVSARFKGIVSKDGKIIQVLNSDTQDVAPGELAQLQMFFTPKVFGQYRIAGRVHYNNKITYEKGSILNVNPGPDAAGFWSRYKYYVVIFVMLLIIILLLVLIILRKRRARRLRQGAGG